MSLGACDDDDLAVDYWLTMLKCANAQRDLQGWEPFISRIRPYLKGQVPNTKLPVDASDVVQDCLMKVWQKIGDFSGSSDGRLMAWIGVILCNTFRDAVRKSRCGATTSLPDFSGSVPIPANDPAAVDRELRVLIELALSRLPKIFAEVIRLRRLEERTDAEIAAIMELGVVNVRQIYHRALPQFKAELQKLL